MNLIVIIRVGRRKGVRIGIGRIVGMGRGIGVGRF